MIEQLIAKLGLDKGNFDKGLQAAQGGVSKLNSALGTFGAAISVGAGIKLFNDARAYADNVGTLSSALGVGTQFLQGFRGATEMGGVAAGQADKALEKLSVRIGEAGKGSATAKAVFDNLGVSLKNTDGTAKSTEEVLMAISDRMQAIEDPTKRAVFATELFGKSGVQLVAVLKQGSAALQAQMDSIDKLSDRQISALDKADKAIKKIQHNITLGVGKAVTGLGGFFSILGRMSAGESWGEARANMAAEDENAAKKRKDLQTETDKLRAAEEKAAEIYAQIEAARKQGDIERLARLEQEKQLLGDINAAKQNQGSAYQNLQQAHEDRTSSSLSEIANSDVYNREGERQRTAARKVIGLEHYAKAARQHGRNDIAEDALSRADTLRKGIGALSEGDRNPLATLAQKARESDEKLKTLADAATGAGLKILPVNGE